ncbi:MAG: tetratricopeptide repeat protein [Xanthobacteraceae bacterium]|nr:tetratricopeptide repeat protein [Xanthobacteraceae bacterium]
MDLHRQGRLSEAEVHYRSLLAKSPSQFDLLHLFGILKLQQGNLAEAMASISRAVEINPSALDARSNLIAALLGLGRPADALDHCDKALAIGPADVGMHHNRGVALMQLARHEEARAAFDRVLAAKPDHVNALFNRAGALAGLRRYEEAIADYDRLLGFAPHHPEALTNRGTVFAQLGRDGDALESFDRALSLAPEHADALTNRGIALRRLMRPQEALASLNQALAASPDHVGAQINRGNVLLDLHRAEDALASFNRALARSPKDPNALTNKAFSLLSLGRFEAALQSCDEALAADAQYVNAALVRGHTLAKLDRPGEAAMSYERVLAIDPGNIYALGASLIAQRAACQWERVDQSLAAIEQSVHAGVAVVPPFNLLGLPIAPAIQLQCAKNFTAQRLPAEPAPFPSRQRAPSGKIKLAYVSGDFRQHPVAYLVSELLERHDRSRFEVIGISYGPDDASDERRRLVAAFDQFHDVSTRTERETAALIHDLQVDIAIDLGGHTENARPGILRDRPASVQVSYLGYTGTMGADFIDYIVADKVALPPDLAPYFTEQIVRLPDCFLVNDATKAISAGTPSRAEAGLPQHGFVFCCFNNSYKISAGVFSVWMRLLAAVEGSVLWLSRMNADAAEVLRSTAAAAGVDPGRIVFAPRVPAMADHLARLRLADLFVDTTDYNAHTTASDALWAGVPMVTCAGATFPGRVAASLLHGIGVAELVTTSIADYEALALKLARDPSLLQSIRQKVQANRLTHPLFDTDRFRRHLEAAYTTMVDIARQGEKPRSFGVDPISA